MSPITKKLAGKGQVLNLSGEDIKEELLEDTNSSGEGSSSMVSNPSSSRGSSSRQYGRVNRIILDKNSDEYRKRRERNNMAVKKSRTKSKMKTQQTMQRVVELKAENERLETKVKILTKELSFLKDLFLQHAGTAHNGHLELNRYNGSHENSVSGGIGGVINSNMISSSALTTASIDCNGTMSQAHLHTDNSKSSLPSSHHDDDE